jgi:molecular chaperone DnaK
VLFLTEPQAAALHYASAERIAPDSTIAVYDLGGGTFDAAVLRKSATGGFEMLGVPDGVEQLGGIDFDDLVLSHVLAGIPQVGMDADMADPVVCSAISRLRRECTEAKEALSTDTEVTIPVLLPQVRTQVRLVRAEFEGMIRSTLDETIQSLRRAIESAGLTPAELSGVLLVGGSSRIPLVTQMISAELQHDVSVDTDPKGAVAMGAALAAHHQITGSEPAVAADDDPIIAPPRPEHDCAPPELPAQRQRFRKTKISAGVVAALVVALWLIPSPISLNNNTSTGGSPPAQAETPGSQGNTSAPPAPAAATGGRRPESPAPQGAIPGVTTPGAPPAPGAPAPQQGPSGEPPVINPSVVTQAEAPSVIPTTTEPPPPPPTDTTNPTPTDTPTTTEAPPPETAIGAPSPSDPETTETAPPTAI